MKQRLEEIFIINGDESINEAVRLNRLKAYYTSALSEIESIATRDLNSKGLNERDRESIIDHRNIDISNLIKEAEADKESPVTKIAHLRIDTDFESLDEEDYSNTEEWTPAASLRNNDFYISSDDESEEWKDVLKIMPKERANNEWIDDEEFVNAMAQFDLIEENNHITTSASIAANNNTSAGGGEVFLEDFFESSSYNEVFGGLFYK